MSISRRTFVLGTAASAGAAALPSMAQAATSAAQDSATYTAQEIVGAGHKFFGAVSEGLAQTVEQMFQSQGRPNGYVLGQEGGGALIAGLRYGEGTLQTKNAGSHKVFWQGPSLGWDFGGNGDRTMILVYDLPTIEAMYRYYPGVNGSAYLVAGLGVSYYRNHEVTVAPIRTGVGARLGVNVGYLKFTRQPTWNPF